MFEIAPAALCSPAEVDAVCVALPPAVLIGDEGFASRVPT